MLAIQPACASLRNSSISTFGEDFQEASPTIAHYGDVTNPACQPTEKFEDAVSSHGMSSRLAAAVFAVSEILFFPDLSILL